MPEEKNKITNNDDLDAEIIELLHNMRCQSKVMFDQLVGDSVFPSAISCRCIASSFSLNDWGNALFFT